MAQWPTDPNYTPLSQINKGNEFDAGDGLIADDVNKIVKNTAAYVKANPTESGTVDLTKLKVGDTVYNVPQGGGGSDINVVQTAGQSKTDVMSQKAVTDSLANKASTSYVQGNPLGSGTATLTKLKIGNIIYNVPQGGGGGGGGTTVVANPTLTGSEANLSGLQVGNTKYGIKALKVTIW